MSSGAGQVTSGALAGIKVLDLSRVVAGPLCASLLGDLGADVIKVEGPNNRDETRGWLPPDVDGVGLYFASANRSKRAIAVDIKEPEGRTLILELAEQADIVIENFTTGTLDRLELGYQQLSAINAGIILCSITGFGQTGPARNEPGYDFIAQAMSGFVSMNGAPDAEGTKTPIAFADLQAGLHATISVLAALHARATTGRGQHCDISLLDSMSFSLLNLATTYLNTGEVPPRYGNEHQTLVPYQRFDTLDDSVIIAVGNDAQFTRLCEALGDAELARDSRFLTASQRISHRDQLIPVLQAQLLRWQSADLLTALREARVPCGPVNTVAQHFGDPQVTARGLVRSVSAPGHVSLKLLNSPLGLGDTPTRITLPPPHFSEHTDEVLAGLGYSPSAIRNLRDKGVIPST
ncbi:CaiB/BaiF CoA transferase family protein [Leucobacter aridicollis]|uniref:CaiB/BaiF CoA transferase family protein n=1 Tax=Leucobacter aridicollis TaxID=283878 RepID=UPI002105D15C|nr:CaiB/BaiF CoA-transferase family protein [Leucobacter aridicollis]UTX51818.1 CoA transferase [Leucobacter aridicollis]